MQRHEDDGCPPSQIVSDPVHEVLEFPDPGWAGEEDRIVRREAVLQSGHLFRGFRSWARRRRLIHRSLRCSVLSYIGRAVVLKAEKSRHRERIGPALDKNI